MHLIYKQELYKEKQKARYELFFEYLVPIMEIVDHPALIEIQKKTGSAAYENNINQDVKLLSIKKKVIVTKKRNAVQHAKRKVSIG